MTLLAVWGALLGRVSGQEEVVIGTPVANRNRVEIEGLIGFFVNTLALRVDLSGSPTVGALPEQVKATAIEGQQNQDIPFEQVVEMLDPVRSLAHSPLFQVMFAWQNSPRSGPELPGVAVRPLRRATQVVAKFDLTLSLTEAGDRITGGVEYATSLFERRTRERYLEYFRQLLEAMMKAEEGQAVEQLQVQTEWEQARRGSRIELGEIEARLAEQEGVREAVVVMRRNGAGDKQLVAYYTCAESSEGEVGAEQLRRGLGEKLPEHMVPSAYVRLGKLPLTPNGKLDRKALPAPEEAHGYEAPVGEIEEKIATIWADVLKVDRVGQRDNFFALGGNSLRAVLVITRLKQTLNVEVALADIFARPVLADLAHGLESVKQSLASAIPRAERTDRIPLSFAQQRLWFLAQMEGGSAAYHMPFAIRIYGRLNTGALRHALDRIVARHEVLRTTFAFVEGEAVQRIRPVEESRFHLLEQDLRGKGEAELERVIVEETDTPFDLEAGSVIRGCLLRLGEEEHALLITMHHIVSDGWSMGIFNQELSALYGAFVKGAADPLPELGLQYADYAVWQRKWIEGEALQQQAEYWKRTLAEAPELLELPTDYGRPAQQDYRGAVVELKLGEELTAGLKQLSQRHGTTLYMTLLAVWGALLGRLSGQEGVVIGTPVANRNRVEIEGLIGFFVNTLALRVDLSGSPTVGALLERVKATAIEGQQNQDIPFEQVVEIVKPVRSLAHSPLFQVMFAWQNASRSGFELPGVAVGSLRRAAQVVAKFDLTLSLQ